jgi:hypothetical protein
VFVARQARISCPLSEFDKSLPTTFFGPILPVDITRLEQQQSCDDTVVACPFQKVKKRYKPQAATSQGFDPTYVRPAKSVRYDGPWRCDDHNVTCQKGDCQAALPFDSTIWVTGHRHVDGTWTEQKKFCCAEHSKLNAKIHEEVCAARDKKLRQLRKSGETLQNKKKKVYESGIKIVCVLLPWGLF